MSSPPPDDSESSRAGDAGPTTSQFPGSPPLRFPLVAWALRRSFAKGYGLRQLRADASAGIVVGIVALPLSMALGIAVGVPPQHGLYTAIVAGFTVALFGGCKFQVTGPTAAFVVILVPVVERFGLDGLLLAGFLSGLILLLMAFMRLGSLLRFIPHPVTTGFTTGIALVIATLQVPDLLGLEPISAPEHYLDRLLVYWNSRGSIDLQEVGVAATTLALLVSVPKLVTRLPAPLIALVAVSAAVFGLDALLVDFDVATIGSRFHTVVDGELTDGIPPALPEARLPWGSELSFATIRELLPAAFAIAMLGAIESLLSAVVADGLTGTRHDSNAELFGLGMGNLLTPLFGGIPATGALARTATNIRAGAVSPISSAVHSIFILLCIVTLSPLVAHIPMASLAALLLVVAWNMSDVGHFVRLLRIAPKSDALVLASCFLLTVLFDMVLAIGVGIVLAALSFMRRMASITEAKLVLDSTEEGRDAHLPDGVSLYEVNGPLFFGAAQSALDALHRSHRDSFSVLILHLGRVPVIDATGFAALESAIHSLSRRGKRVILVGPLPEPRSIFSRAQLAQHEPGLLVAPDLEHAIELAGNLVAETAAS